jgi:hypothetical protein
MIDFGSRSDSSDVPDKRPSPEAKIKWSPFDPKLARAPDADATHANFRSRLVPERAVRSPWDRRCLGATTRRPAP